MRGERKVDNAADSGIMESGGDNMRDTLEIAAERQKILDGTYPSRVTNAQRKHIEGTREFEQKRAAMPSGSEPSKLNPGINAQELVDRYKGTGIIYFKPLNNKYPREDVIADAIIGETWVKSLGRYVETRVFAIMYSGKGVHIIPMNGRGRM